MKAGRTLLRIAGWLLTPFIAWAASFLGATLGAWLSGGAKNMMNVLIVTVIFGAVSALLAAWAWLRYLRHSPRLQHALEVAPDGTPLVVVEDIEAGGKP